MFVRISKKVPIRGHFPAPCRILGRLNKFRDILHSTEKAEIEMDPEEASKKSKCFYEIKIDLALVGNRRCRPQLAIY